MVERAACCGGRVAVDLYQEEGQKVQDLADQDQGRQKLGVGLDDPLRVRGRRPEYERE